MTRDETGRSADGIYQYCVEPGCSYTAKWNGGSAADDPALEHLKENPQHTVRSGVHIGHHRLMKLQEQGKEDWTREVDPDNWRGEQPTTDMGRSTEADR